MAKRTVVLGGAGFIGSHLCLKLLEEGHEVFCVDMRDAANAPLLRGVMRHPAFRYVHHNIIHPFGIRCDEIYNLASPSMVRYDRAMPVATLRTAMQGSINALDTARTEHARILYASSGSVDASPVVNPEGCPTRYIITESKRAAEALHRAYHAEHGVDTRIARIYNTYGTGAEVMDQRVVMKMTVAALGNHDIVINGSGEQQRSFCWVEDVVEGLIRQMAAKPTEEIRTIDFGSTHEVSINALAAKIISLTESSSRIIHTKERTDEVSRRAPDLTAARRHLGWTARTPLIEGLRRTIAYARKEMREGHWVATWAEVN